MRAVPIRFAAAVQLAITNGPAGTREDVVDRIVECPAN
jgi:hypothetical protein